MPISYPPERRLSILMRHHKAFPPGEFFTVPPLPNVTAVNALGGLNIAADRLAIIDGQGEGNPHPLTRY